MRHELEHDLHKPRMQCNPSHRLLKENEHGP